MSNVIQLLERLGQDASLQTVASFEQEIKTAEIKQELKSALLGQDKDELAKLLDTKSDIVCLVVPAEDDEPDTEEPEEKESIQVAVNS